jgi:hypothetical protein
MNFSNPASIGMRILTLTITLILACITTKAQSYVSFKNISRNDSIKYSEPIKTSFVLLRLIQANQRDSIINFFMNDHWIEFYHAHPETYSGSIDDAISLIKSYGMPSTEQMSICKTSSGEQKTGDFPDKYGLAIRFNLSPETYRKNFGLIEFYYTEDQYDKVCVIFSSNPGRGKQLKRILR